MKRIMIVGLVVFAIAVGTIFVWQFFQEDPADVAESFLSEFAQGDFAALDAYFKTEEKPNLGELERSFTQFSRAFNLTEIKIVDFAPLSKTGKLAEFLFEISYESLDFPAKEIRTSLSLERSSLFAEWEVRWDNNLPLPEYGLDTEYRRVRLEPERGSILAQSGEVLAGKGSLVSVGVQPDRISEPELLLTMLEKELNLNPDYVRRQYEAPNIEGHWFVPLATINEAEFNRIDSVLRPIPGVFFRRIDARAYPLAEEMAHLTGYLGEVTATMQESYPERDYLTGEITGRSGLEGSADDRLRGRPGYRFYLEPQGQERILVAEKEIVAGENLSLTIDPQMQSLAYEILQDRIGALVILDAETGAILTLASTPSYDPNEFVAGISTKRWQELSSDLNKPMFNRALQGMYPPGSVFKVITVAAALDQNIVQPTTIFIDQGELYVEGNKVRNFQEQIFGEHNLHRAVVDSINTTIAQVALDLGAEKLEAYFNDWGLAEEIYLGLPMVPGKIGAPGRSKVALAWTALGQDQVLLSPLHLTQIFAAFANGGYAPNVHLTVDEDDRDAATKEPFLQPETIEAVNAMLADVVSEGTGIQSATADLTLYGKTGTAETTAGMHAWFAGHTQLPNGQKIAFSLLVEEGGVGGQVAAPLMREYFENLLQGINK